MGKFSSLYLSPSMCHPYPPRKIREMLRHFGGEAIEAALNFSALRLPPDRVSKTPKNQMIFIYTPPPAAFSLPSISLSISTRQSSPRRFLTTQVHRAKYQASTLVTHMLQSDLLHQKPLVYDPRRFIGTDESCVYCAVYEHTIRGSLSVHWHL